jgi:hypothetical protein
MFHVYVVCCKHNIWSGGTVCVPRATAIHMSQRDQQIQHMDDFSARNILTLMRNNPENTLQKTIREITNSKTEGKETIIKRTFHILKHTQK